MSHSESNQRQDWLDVSKGIAILLIVLGHCLRGLDSAHLWPEFSTNLGVDRFLYSFHLAVFFFLSGVLFKPQPMCFLRKAILTRSLKLLYPYALWVIIQGTVMAVFSSNLNQVKLLSSIPYDLINAPSQFWFLPVLLWMVLLTYVISNIRYWKVTLIITSLIVLVSGEFGRFGSNFIFYSTGAVLGVDFFTSIIKRLHWLVFLFIFIFLEIVYYYIEVDNSNLLLTLVGFSGVFFVTSFSLRFQSWLVILFGYLGRRSLEVFLVHILFGSGARIVLIKIFHVSDFYTHVGFGVFSGVFGSLLFYWLVSRFRLNWLFYPPAFLTNYIIKISEGRIRCTSV